MLFQTKYGENSSQKFVFRLSMSTETSSRSSFLTGCVTRPPGLQHLRKEIPSTWTILRPGSARSFPLARAPGSARSPARALHQHHTSSAFDSSTTRRWLSSTPPSCHYGPAVDPLAGHPRHDCVHRWATRELVLRPSLLALVRRWFAGAHTRATAAAPLRCPVCHRHVRVWNSRHHLRQ